MFVVNYLYGLREIYILFSFVNVICKVFIWIKWIYIFKVKCVVFFCVKYVYFLLFRDGIIDVICMWYFGVFLKWEWVSC